MASEAKPPRNRRIPWAHANPGNIYPGTVARYARTATPLRVSLARLNAVHAHNHSARTFSKPRSRNWRKPIHGTTGDSHLFNATAGDSRGVSGDTIPCFACRAAAGRWDLSIRRKWGQSAVSGWYLIGTVGPLCHRAGQEIGVAGIRGHGIGDTIPFFACRAAARRWDLSIRRKWGQSAVSGWCLIGTVGPLCHRAGQEIGVAGGGIGSGLPFGVRRQVLRSLAKQGALVAFARQRKTLTNATKRIRHGWISPRP